MSILLVNYELAETLKQCEQRSPRPELHWFIERLGEGPLAQDYSWMTSPTWWLIEQLNRETSVMNQALANASVSTDPDAFGRAMQDATDSGKYCAFISDLIEISRHDVRLVC
ncbi:hypothetical protein SAMN02799624_05375 [Paenibacillus sp. UNC496MF]|uniref:hypothetical protein n=1 Tax=Paenibacillus sp. UNC496MF TaxID=1502753 RepID=UPI0008E482B1|nr:hypothetical protein [Paenibacillus sp. UNC496MF]SFJ64995.1 hypothetical protein SAMN02799624_05375 [Paenibacillus sp. UNC496MF]